MLNTNELTYWLVLAQLYYGNNTNKIIHLLEQSVGFETLISQEKLADILNANPKLIDEHLAWLEQPDNFWITYRDPQYPPLLKQISSPPLVLFGKGNANILNDPQIAMVGSRRASHAGLRHAKKMAADLASCGFTITSGFAMGIDTASHEGALAGKGKTIAVMGTGLNKIYPSANTKLFASILEHEGAIISELSLRAVAKAQHFPQRNRIISGLSLGTVIIEAALNSGSLITARLANEQGREVFAVPGTIDNPMSKGCHQLIRNGAKLVENVEDILEEFSDTELKKLVTKKILPTKNKNNQLPEDLSKLLEYIDYTITPVDLIIARSNKPAKLVASMLLILEVEEYIKQSIGGYIKL